MEDGLTESGTGRKPSNSAKSTYKCALALGDLLTLDQRQALQENVAGYDITPQMVRLARVNLFLHGFPNPQIHDYDSLSTDTRWDEKADLILANPPFMTPKGGVTPHSRFSISSTRTEVLFLDYILEHLTPRGRAGVIVPEGIMFVETGAYERLRKMLVAERMLIASVSLPHGVFKPYASVKTHILFVDRVLAPKTDKVLFIETESDGFSQTDTRQRVDRDCLKAAMKLIRNFRHALRDNQPLPAVSDEVRSYYVDTAELLRSRKTHLIGRWYDLPNRLKRKPGLSYKTIKDVCNVYDGLSPNMATLPGDYPLVVPAKERKTADHFDYDAKAVCIPMVSSSGHGKADIKRLHYQEGKFALADTMSCLVSKDEDALNPRFLYALLDELRDLIIVPLMSGATNVTMKSPQIEGVVIPVPKPKDQQRVVRRIDLLHYADRIEELHRDLSRDIGGGGSVLEHDFLTDYSKVLRKEAEKLPTLKDVIE